MARPVLRWVWRIARVPTVVRAASLAVALVVASGALGSAWAGEPKRVGPDRCGECHKKEYKAWLLSSHARLITDGYDEDTSDEVDSISDEVGVFDVESDGTCGGCHYNTYKDVLGETELVATDCEACHGLGSEWVDVHSDLGSRDGKPIIDPKLEDPAHRRRRIQRAVAAGWRSPQHATVDLLSQCFRCHLGPDEDIVDDGGHLAGSKIDLVSWFRGEIRHNFQRTGQGENGDLPAARRRLFHVLGRMLDVEYGIRGLSEAYSKSDFFEGVTSRITRSLAALKKVEAVAPVDEIREVVRLGDSVALKIGGRISARDTADRIHRAIERFASKYDGSGLGAIDPLISKKTVGRSFNE